ncbi:hypothetical protein ACIBFB_24965 [Nocardiopsis sp. NPDC050513]|uniref:hypothetical protein n=1 Tax=Nocardiopsis sp. NPDC050513 TaxID=3364338 RepID=UPI003788FF5D
MSAFTALSAGGLAALLMAPVPGADTLHVVLESSVAESPLRQGGHVDFTIRVRNAGGESLPEAQVVQFLPAGMSVRPTSPGAVAEGGRIVWTGALEPGERAVLHAVGEVTGALGGARAVTTVCVRPDPDATLASCASSAQSVRGPVLAPWAIGGASLLVLLATGAVALYRRSRRTASAAEARTGAEAEGPEPAPGPEGPEPTAGEERGTAPDEEPAPANVYHLDSRR